MKKKSDHSLKLAIVGSFPPPLGGCSVLLHFLKKELGNQKNVDTFFINTGGVRDGGFVGILKLFQVIFHLFNILHKVDVVSLHVTTSSLPSWGLLVSVICYFLRKPLVLRKFGGTDFFSFPLFQRNSAKLAVSLSKLYLAETQSLVARAKDMGIQNVKWFPNNRPIPEGNVPSRFCCKRFVFMSQVKKTKGIFELRDAVIALQGKGILHVYGPLYDEIRSADIDYGTSVKYMGEVSPNNVASVLCCYDALVLPTYHEGEGYPGIIIEGFGAGLPVITTEWKNIPEIVDFTVGILVQPKNVEQIKEAMELLINNPDFYLRLRESTKKKADEFSSEVWTAEFVKYCCDLVA